VAYDGTDFQGFQWQPKGKTVQGLLEAQLTRVCGEPVKVVGAGRTDAGVHALGQVIHFDTESAIPAERLASVLNAQLGMAVRVRLVEQAAAEFHARFHATERAYEYWIARYPLSPFLARYVTEQSNLPPDAGARMQEALDGVVGKFDFQPFSSSGSEVTCTFRTVREVRVSESGGFLCVAIRADAFLRSMVRLLVGLALEIGAGRSDPGAIRRVLDAGERVAAGQVFSAAPPQGLYLARVEYPDGYPAEDVPGTADEAGSGAGGFPGPWMRNAPGW
jgi:tRNA pseudouridine38-40 synthase